MKFIKKDLIFSLITGLTTGLVGWKVLLFLGRTDVFGYSLAWLIVIIPVTWFIGVNFGYFLGKWMPFFNQFGRFVAVGFTNAAVDFGVLNLQISLTGIESGWHYSVFKSVSFIIGVTHSYIWNKYWVFEAGQSGGGRSELVKFLAVNVVAIIVNVGIASFVVNYVDPIGGLNTKIWANVGAVVGSAFAISLTFVGARLIVFKKNDPNIVP